MTRAERVFARRWRSVLLACVLIALSGAVLIVWTRVNAETSARKEATAEANLRGSAVSTLATDVRKLRSQLQAGGKTPVAPDPSSAVKNLPARTEVPVPIPGPPGPSGAAGSAGQPGPTGSPGPTGATGPTGSPGGSGANGQDGPAGPQGPPGSAGAAGQDGKDGTNGRDGAAGSPPAGWTYTDPAGVAYTCTPVSGFDPSAPRYACAPDTTPPTSSPSALSPSSGGLLGVVVLASSAIYRRI